MHDVFETGASFRGYEHWETFHIGSLQIDTWTCIHSFFTEEVNIGFTSFWRHITDETQVFSNISHQLIWFFVPVFSIDFNKPESFNSTGDDFTVGKLF